MFANGPRDQGSVPGHVIPKTLKMVLDTSLPNTHHYKVCIKGKVEKAWGRSKVPPTPRCCSYWKGSLRVGLDYARQLYFYVYIYIYIYSRDIQWIRGFKKNANYFFLDNFFHEINLCLDWNWFIPKINFNLAKIFLLRLFKMSANQTESSRKFKKVQGLWFAGWNGKNITSLCRKDCRWSRNSLTIQ